MGSSSTSNDIMNNIVKEEPSDDLDSKEVEELEWTVDQDILFLYSLHGYKPVGPNKHFRMLAIQERFSNALHKNVSSKAIWKKLNTLYDLEALDEAEAEADANDAVVIDFALPEDEFGAMMKDKINGRPIKVEKPDIVNYNDNEEVLGRLSDIKSEPELNDQQTEIGAETPKGTVTGKEVVKKDSAKRGPKKKDVAPTTDNVQKKDVSKETPKKDSGNKKELVKDPKRVVSKEDESKDTGKKIGLEYKKDLIKEEKKDAVTKANKKELIEKKITEQNKKDSEVKRSDQKKTSDSPKNQRAETVKPRSETPKQLRTETKKTETKTLRSETPKPQRTESPPKPQRVEALKKESGSEKKKEVADKKLETKSPEKTPEPRGAKLRTREKKDTEPEKSDTTPVTKRERSRDSTSKVVDTPSEEPPLKKSKTPVAKGRPTRNSVDPQQKPASPAVNATSPSKRRSRLL